MFYKVETNRNAVWTDIPGYVKQAGTGDIEIKIPNLYDKYIKSLRSTHISYGKEKV